MTIPLYDLAPDNAYIGVMLPYTPIHYLLFNVNILNSKCRDLLVMTSGNKSDEPICYKNSDAMNELGDIADYFLMNDREIHIRVDDSVLRVVNGREYLIRRARGYAPAPVVSGNILKSINNRFLSVLALSENLFALI